MFQALDNVVRLLKRKVPGKSGRDSDGEHAGGVGGGEAARGVFKRGAVLRRNAEALGGQQIDIGRGLRMLDFIGGGDGLETCRQAGDV